MRKPAATVAIRHLGQATSLLSQTLVKDVKKDSMLCLSKLKGYHLPHAMLPLTCHFNEADVFGIACAAGIQYSQATQ